jgi:hypothetical protein
MADREDLPEGRFGEPETGEVEVLIVAEEDADGDVLVVEEEILVWPGGPPGLQLRPAQLALYAGWTMAVLYGAIGAPGGRSVTLPTVNELAPGLRRRVELARLRHLLSALLPDHPGLASLREIPPIPLGDDPDETRARRSALEAHNLAILTALTATQPDLQLAYEAGRSLRDTASPPGGAEGLRPQLDRGRIVKLQEWLGALAPEFPPLTAAVVAASLGRWSDLAEVTVSATVTGRPTSKLSGLPQLRSRSQQPSPESQAQIADSMCAYLLRQGDTWLMLLTGGLATTGLLTPEGYVAAGEAALRRTASIVRGIVRHYWLGLLCVAAALGFTLFLAAAYLAGAGRVWTSIACVVGGLGVSAQTIASTSSRLAAEAERPVFAMAEEDAMAWAITAMPPLPNLPGRGVRHLRRAGVARTASLGRF